MLKSISMARVAVIVLGLVVVAHGQGVPDGSSLLTPAREAVLSRVEPGSLKAHVSFLASDALEGRDTPSRGLEIAGEYIAAQFRAAGLEPAGDDGYFQTAHWVVSEADPSSFACQVKVGDRVLPFAADQVTLMGATGPLDLDDLPMIRLTDPSEEALNALTEEAIAGKAVLVDLPPPNQGEERAAMRLLAAVMSRLRTLKAAALVRLAPGLGAGGGLPKGRLIDPERRPVFRQAERPTAGPIPITLHDPATVEALRAPGAIDAARFSLKLGAPVERPAALRNVAGILRGSDPELKDTYVIVSAHYDHVGVGAGPMSGGLGSSPTDRIFNGANDDASGTAMVVELARALGRMEERPKRSILFLTFFGEEKGLLGSRFYGQHPIVPLEKTVAMLNLEQVGRTDDEEGPQVNRASMTGFDFSDVGERLAKAGSAVGVEVFKHPQNSDAFFGRSDNQALADQGVPAHTLCVAFIYPDYHQSGDHWDKLDYDNMARIGRAIALGVLQMADDPTPPAWNRENAKASKYVKAADALGKAPAAAQ